MRKHLVTLSVLFVFASSAHAADCSKVDANSITQALHDGKQSGIAEFRHSAECFNWPVFYMAAKQIFLIGEKDDAVRWFYAGQLRGRVSASFDPDPSASKALLSALNETVGRPVNEYAGGDLQKWIAAMDWALKWDAAHPLSPDAQLLLERNDVVIDPKAFSETYEKVRTSLRSLRDKIAKTDPAEWHRKRHANGLE